MHPLLQLQLGKFIDQKVSLPEGWKQLLEEISKTYYQQNTLAEVPVAEKIGGHTLLDSLLSSPGIISTGTASEKNITELLEQEIIKRHEAEFKSEALSSYFNQIANDLQLGLIEFGRRGQVIRSNQTCATLFDCSSNEVNNYIDAARLKATQATFEENEVGRQQAFEALLLTGNGSERWTLCSTTAIKSIEGEIIGFISALFDIHDRKMKEEELKLAHRNAEEALNSKKTFLANISHEIRTPINAIVGMSGLLQQSKLSGSQKEYVEALKSSAEGLLVLINDLLDVSKVESGKMELEEISFSLPRLSKNIVKSLGLKAEEKGLQLNWFVDPKVKEWHLGDPTRITQIITNLIGNAIKFTRSGYVKLKIALEGETEEMQRLMIAVSDTGIGITNDRLPEIFNQFSQEDTSTTRKYGGTGLGLSISRQLVELMGSDLKVKSEKGKGSEFYFTLELPNSKPNETEADLHEMPDLSGVDLLLVEDNEINRFLALTIFKNWGANIVAVNNGLEAVDELKARPYHLVLMDLQMPYMDGFEATRIIRTELRLNLPIIALTANSLNSEREQCLMCGMNDYVSKPFQPDQLYRKVKTYLANVRYMKRKDKRKAS